MPTDTVKTRDTSWAACRVCSTLFLRVGPQPRTTCSDDCRRARDRENDRKHRQATRCRLGGLPVFWAACCMCGSLFMRVGKRVRTYCSDQCKYNRSRGYKRVYRRRRYREDRTYRATILASVAASTKRRRQADPAIGSRKNARARDRYRRMSQDPVYMEARRQQQREQRSKRLAANPEHRPKRNNARVREQYWLKKETDPVSHQAMLQRRAAKAREKVKNDPAHRAARRDYARRYKAAEAATAAKVTIGLLAQLTKDLEDGTQPHSGQRKR